MGLTQGVQLLVGHVAWIFPVSTLSTQETFCQSLSRLGKLLQDLLAQINGLEDASHISSCAFAQQLLIADEDQRRLLPPGLGRHRGLSTAASRPHSRRTQAAENAELATTS